MKLRRFQAEFLRRALAPGVDTAALSLPRANGKSWLAAHVLERCLTPGDPLHQPGAEYLLGAGSIEQARHVFGFVRAALEPGGAYRWTDSMRTLGARHKATGTRLRVQSSNGRTAMGLVRTPLAVMDEPGSYEVVGGQLMADALATAQGKPGSDLRVIYIGTLAPAQGGWWHELVDGGSRRSTYVQALRGDPERWDDWNEIRRCNPLTAVSATFRRKLLEERDEARDDPRKRARFLSYRLNVPTRDPEAELIPMDDWRRTCARQVPPPAGAPIIGLDMGAGLSWSAAAAVWQNGRTEAVAWAPGRPSLDRQERRDKVPAGFYTELFASGALRVDGALAVPRASVVIGDLLSRWRPAGIVCDRFRWHDVIDAVQGRCVVVPRVNGSINSTEDIGALRRWAASGPLAVAPEARKLLTVSLGSAVTRTNDKGETRMVKDVNYANGRDDAAAALALAVGAVSRTTPAAPMVIAMA